LYLPVLCTRGRICQECSRQFFICKSCDRGHRYCSTDCQSKGSGRRNRVAKKRYAQSKQGRQNHAARQMRYRNKKRESSKNIVTDETSKKEKSKVRPHFVTRLTYTKRFYQGTRCCICLRPCVWPYLEKKNEDSS
jgi:hypothetical protein